MFLSSSYSAFIAIAVFTVVVFIVLYCVRLNHMSQQIFPHPMQVVVVAQPPQLQHPDMCCTMPYEQPPPPYNAVVSEMNINPNMIRIHNGS